MRTVSRFHCSKQLCLVDEEKVDVIGSMGPEEHIDWIASWLPLSQNSSIPTNLRQSHLASHAI